MEVLSLRKIFSDRGQLLSIVMSVGEPRIRLSKKVMLPMVLDVELAKCVQTKCAFLSMN
jgi:hypothetical protein